MATMQCGVLLMWEDESCTREDMKKLKGTKMDGDESQTNGIRFDDDVFLGRYYLIRLIFLLLFGKILR